mmetsp:Transcript_35465/g.77630  ORF Transcript_35465/g.77630 Transcript_35465/m.77630 type:complete len:778 (+) Transcript_35465:159-2492(+)
MKNVSLEAMAEHFLSNQFSSTAAAILRRPAVMLANGVGATAGCLLAGVPHAVVLSSQELTELLERLRDGVAEADLWSLQTFVEPETDLRVISVYSCDVQGSERSEIFGRRFKSVYYGRNAASTPIAEALEPDECKEVTPAQRQIVEAKTLSAVRFASRVHSLDFEGLLLEFVFDTQGRAVLHGCWCASLFGKERRRQLIASGNAPSRQARCEVERPTAALHTCPVPQVSAPQEMPGTELLLEAWNDEVFLGEAWLPADGDNGLTYSLQLEGPGPGPEGDPRPETRPDPKKVGTQLGGTVHIGFSRDGADVLRLGPSHAEGLHLGGGPCRVRLVIWTRPSSGAFTALWVSKEATDPENLRWDETVVLSAWPQEPPPVPAVSHGHSHSAWQGPGPPHHMEVTLKSPRQNVCGAQLFAHWGMQEEGSMSSHRLASQVAQRLGSGRLNRSALLTQLSQQLLEFHELQQSWGRRVGKSEAVFNKAKEELRQQEEHAAAVREETAASVDQHNRRLAETCRELYARIDEHRFGEHEEYQELLRSQQRLEAQRSMAKKLKEESCNLSEAIERTQHEVAEAAASPPAKPVEQTNRSPTAVPCGSRSLAQAAASPPAKPVEQTTRSPTAVPSGSRSLAQELASDRGEVAALKLRLAQLQEELAGERWHALHLEAFVQRIAAAPSASVRTGGGFMVDSAAKREATWLWREATAGKSVPGGAAVAYPGAASASQRAGDRAEAARATLLQPSRPHGGGPWKGWALAPQCREAPFHGAREASPSTCCPVLL